MALDQSTPPSTLDAVLTQAQDTRTILGPWLLPDNEVTV